ncbi:MAG: efflux RND transporter periplasmic adaptor subunit [Candidatus Eremiobacteraeota bacterium]|nr:efflux RND transporter periplasmic adaptor subunit [Candidatus Eremiobacteraeota bacterium]
MRTAERMSLLVNVVALACAASCSSDHFAYSGTLQTESARVGSTIGGRVTNIFASDGQRVRTGQALVQLDASGQQAALAAARSQAAQARAALADLVAGPRPEEVSRALAAEASAKAVLDKTPQELRIARDNLRQAQAALAQAHAQYHQATLAYERMQRLFAEGAIAAQARDDARATYQSAAAAVRSQRAAVAAAHARLVEAQTADTAVAQQSYTSAVANRQLVQAGARPDQIGQARAVLDAANANVAAAETNLREMTIRAPAAGVIDALDLRAGDLVGPRAQVAIVRELRDPYVRIYVAQRDLGKISVGQTVTIRSDALAGLFSGRIEQIDQDAQFTPRDVQTREDRADLTYGVKVRIHDPQGRLPGGTTVEVSL